ncbi:MAG: saccharopine dehydrogenase NADP-binding domain-containing protein, partial [Acidobacteria bacterium]|nr:saccharopine dehydrogenase NADP-binding domain-containing protein [Acidobacteriota bacterium]
MKILIIGAGRMGQGAVFDLAHNSPEVESITIADADYSKAVQITEKINSPKISAIELNVSNYESTIFVMRGHDAAISCVNYWYNFELSKAAIETGTNFCDLGGNNSVVD